MSDRPILIAYDGSDYAKAAIEQAADQLQNGRRAIVLTVSPRFRAAFVGVGVPPPGLEEGIANDARRVAEEGARLARDAGFDAEPAVERGDPVWERIVKAAEEHDAGIVVSGATESDAGLASGIVNTTFQVGGALGLAVLATLSTTRTENRLAEGASDASALTSGYHLAFYIAAGLAAAAIVVAVTVLERATPAKEAEAVAEGTERYA